MFRVKRPKTSKINGPSEGSEGSEVPSKGSK